MFFFGHLGIGSKLVAPFTRGLPKSAIFLGTLLPDLLDKPLYYGLSWLTHKHGAQLGLISGTRTFGHSAFLLLILTLYNLKKKSLKITGIIFGIGSHLILDGWGDHFEALSETALFWPFHWQFPTIPFADLSEHLLSMNRPIVLYGEILGLFLIFSNSSLTRKLMRNFKLFSGKI